MTEGATPSFQESDETRPNSDVEGPQSSSFHPNNYQMPLQTTNMTSPNSAPSLTFMDASYGIYVFEFLSQFLVLL